MEYRSCRFLKMTHPKKISILDFTYDLPAGRIAAYPLPERDASKLLICNNDQLQETTYRDLYQYLPENSLLIFNNTRVIKARILFTKPSGGTIEIFLLEPFETDYTTTLSATKKTSWKCMVGGLAKWKGGEITIDNGPLAIKAVIINKLPDATIVEFSWTPADWSFAEVLEQCGDIPLPPYIKRKAEKEDRERYQTIYAQDEGSVAAPTAGLHFTKEVFDSLAKKNIKTEFVTLHVGAGTFKPVKAALMQDHEMHAEWIDVSVDLIESLFEQLDKTIVAVGTTSLRTLESLYWLGLKTLFNPAIESISLDQWEVYGSPFVNSEVSASAALTSLLGWMKKNNKERLFTQSQILIAPGYTFRITNALITNFHQPQSTLLLLVAAAVGNDGPAGQERWRKIYNYALQNNFRFLSYGDGSLLFINK